LPKRVGRRGPKGWEARAKRFNPFKTPIERALPRLSVRSGERLRKTITKVMAFFKKVQKKLTGLWYASAVTVDYMANGRTVKLDGLGTFYYTCDTAGMGVNSADKVTAAQIKGARVRFIPETKMSGQGDSRHATRSLVSQSVFWEEWGGESTAS